MSRTGKTSAELKHACFFHKFDLNLKRSFLFWFPLLSAVSPLPNAVGVNLLWLKFLAARTETSPDLVCITRRQNTVKWLCFLFRLVIYEPTHIKKIHISFYSQFGLRICHEYKLIACIGISCSQESLHFCL